MDAATASSSSSLHFASIYPPPSRQPLRQFAGHLLSRASEVAEKNATLKWAIDGVVPAAKAAYNTEIGHLVVQLADAGLDVVDNQVEKHGVISRSEQVYKSSVERTKSVVSTSAALAAPALKATRDTYARIVETVTTTVAPLANWNEEAADEEEEAASSATTTTTTADDSSSKRSARAAISRRLRLRASELATYWTNVSASNPPEGLSGYAARALVHTLSVADKTADKIGLGTDAELHSPSDNETIGQVGSRLQTRIVVTRNKIDHRARLSALSALRFTTATVVGGYHAMDSWPQLAKPRDMIVSKSAPVLDVAIKAWNNALSWLEKTTTSKHSESSPDREIRAQYVYSSSPQSKDAVREESNLSAIADRSLSSIITEDEAQQQQQQQQDNESDEQREEQQEQQPRPSSKPTHPKKKSSSRSGASN